MAQDLDKKYASKEDVKRINEAMALVIIVLKVGFVLLLVTVAGLVMTLMWDEHSQINEQNKLLIELNDKVK